MASSSFDRLQLSHMRRSVQMSILAASALGLLLVWTIPLGAQEKPQIKVQEVLNTTATGSGNPLRVPERNPQAIAVVADFPPGAETPRHTHKFPRYVYVIDGTLTVEAEGEEKKQYSAGSMFVETEAAHQARNSGTTPTRVLVVDIVEEGTERSTPIQ